MGTRGRGTRQGTMSGYAFGQPDLQRNLVPRGDVRSREGMERGIRRCESKFQFRLEAVESLPFLPLLVPPD